MQTDLNWTPIFILFRPWECEAIFQNFVLRPAPIQQVHVGASSRSNVSPTQAFLRVRVLCRQLLISIRSWLSFFLPEVYPRTLSCPLSMTPVAYGTWQLQSRNALTQPTKLEISKLQIIWLFAFSRLSASSCVPVGIVWFQTRSLTWATVPVNLPLFGVILWTQLVVCRLSPLLLLEVFSPLQSSAAPIFIFHVEYPLCFAKGFLVCVARSCAQFPRSTA